MSKIIAILIYLLIALDISAKPVYGFADYKVEQMTSALTAYNSPMAAYSRELITIAEKYNLDWTLLAAIAGTESSFGKRMPYECLNPYGWGIYGDNKLCFESFPAAAEAVAIGLSTKYNTQSLETIGQTYNKVSTDSWVNHTRFFMNKIKSASIPVESLPIEL